MYWRIEIILEGQIQGIGTIVVIDGKLLNLFLITVKDVFTKLALRERQWNMLDLTIHCAICHVFLDVEGLLSEDNVTIVGVIVLLGSVKVTQHESKSDIFIRNDLRRRI